MTPGKVLIVGASLAGSAAAWHLHDAGWDVTLVDPTDAPPESYLIQLDETAQSLLTAMDADHIVAHHAGPSPTTSVRWGRRRLRRLSIDSGQLRLASRRDVVTAMRHHIPVGVHQRIGARLTSLQFTSEGVGAGLDDGTTDVYDIVVGADGVNSTVRSLTHGPDVGIHRNGVSHVWFKLPARLPDDVAVLANRERVALQIYPYPGGNATLVVAALELPKRAADQSHFVKAGIAEVLDGLGGDLAPVANALRNDGADPFVTRFTQIRLPSWSTGRTVLVGDAAHCIDPLSGVGAHTALLDAAVLAESLRAEATAVKAFAAFEARARPFAQAAQALTARVVEYVTRPGGRTRTDTMLGSLADAARLAQPRWTPRVGECSA